MNGADREYCRTCGHYGWALGNEMICNYSYNTGRCRSLICPAGVGCTEHTALKGTDAVIARAKRKARIPTVSDKPRPGQLIDKKVALELYEAEKSDYQIAQAFGCTRAAVRCWRTRSGLAPNYINGKKRAEEGGQHGGMGENSGGDTQRDGQADACGDACGAGA